jgi:hypothetical protein
MAEMISQRASVVYGIRLGQFDYSFNLDERTKMLIDEYGLSAVQFSRDDKPFGWRDIIVTRARYPNHHEIFAKGNGGRTTLEPDSDLVDRLTKFRSDHGDCNKPQWHLYLFSTTADVFTLPDGDRAPGRAYPEGPSPNFSSTNDPPSGVHW